MEQRTKLSYKKIIIALLCILAVVYIVYHIAQSLRDDVELFAVRPDTADDVQTFTGYLFFDETVLTAASSGILNYHYSDGEKVASGSVVADVYPYGDNETAEKIADLQSQIHILKRSTSISGTTVEQVQNQIDTLSTRISELTAAGNTSAANMLANELLAAMAKKDLLSSGKSDYDSEIAALEAQKAVLVASLGTPSESISVSRSGYFYSGVDGYEKAFTLAAAEAITFSSFDALTAMTPSVTSGAVGTLMTDFHWYYVCKTTSGAAEGFTVGNTYDCRFPDNSYVQPILMQLVAKQTDENGNALLTFSSTSLPAVFDMTRCQRMEAVRTTYSGYRIPAGEVRVIDGATYVYIYDEGSARLREVDIIWEENGYYLVSDSYESPSENPVLSLNDLIIVGEKDLYDGKIIN